MDRTPRAGVVPPQLLLVGVFFRNPWMQDGFIISAVALLLTYYNDTVSWQPSAWPPLISCGRALPQNSQVPRDQGSTSSSSGTVHLTIRGKPHPISKESQFPLTCLDLLFGKGAFKPYSISFYALLFLCLKGRDVFIFVGRRFEVSGGDKVHANGKNTGPRVQQYRFWSLIHHYSAV